MTRGLFLPADDLCPKCKIGHIYPTSGREFSSKSEWPLPKHEFEKTTLVCDKCPYMVEELVVRDVGHGTDTVRVTKKDAD